MELRAAPKPVADRWRISETFETYVRATDSQNNSELERGTDLLWIDSLPETARKKAYADLMHGEVQVKQRTTLQAGREISCPGCMIHHWEGLVFIRGARLNDVLRVLEDYDHHAKDYAPDVVRSRIDARDGDRFRVSLRFRRQKVITVVLNTEHDVHYVHLNRERRQSRSYSTHIGEVENAGKPDEHELPAGKDHGFLWRLYSYWRFEERDGGVYVECEAISLTRNVPAGLGWLIEPIVRKLPRESLVNTLLAMRAFFAPNHA